MKGYSVRRQCPTVERRTREGKRCIAESHPENPIIAYRKFTFADQANWIYLHKNMRVYANVDMDSDDGICFRMQSNRQDTVRCRI